MKKSILMSVLFAMTFGLIAAGCQSEAKVDDDGAKVEIKGNE